ncbi:MAG: hypothetical protein ACHRXM_03365 [Isosphaerales bacterium]
MGRRLGLTAYVAAVFMGGVLAAPALTSAEDKPDVKAGVDAKAAFKRLKTLVGSWKSEISDEYQAGKSKEHPDHAKGDSSVTYKLTGAGSALVETQFPGAAHEMVSVYHLDGDDLRMTHYCALGNQPRVKLDRANSTSDHLIFVFDGGTNLDPQKDMHIHALQITFHEDGKVTSAWDGYQGGKKAHTTSFVLTRQPESESQKHSAGSR